MSLTIVSFALVMEISAMRMSFLALGLSLCLLLSSFHVVSSQDDGASRVSHLDLIEREYQDSVNALQGKEGEDQSAKIQSENQKNTTVTDKNTISLSLSDESEGTFSDSVDNSTQVGAVSDESVKRSNLLDQLELEFEAHLNGLNEAGSDGVKAESKDDEELSAYRQKMLEDIERDFEAASTSLKQLKTDELSEGNDEEQSAKRHSLLEEIEREFEAATKDLEQLKVNDFTGDKDDEEQSAKRKSMLEAIEREFEAAIEGLEELKVSDSTGSKDDEEQSAKRLSMLEEIEREFEAATKSLEQLKVNDSIEDKVEEGQDAKRQSMLEEIEREFEAATDSLKRLQVDDSTEEDTEQTAKRQSMLEEIEREFEAATKGLEQLKVNDYTEGSDNEEQSAKRKSMLQEIEREFEAAIGGLKQIKDDDSRNIEEQSAKRKIMLEDIEREFEAAKKQSGSITPGFLGLGQSGVCGCFNQDNDGLKQDEDVSIAISTKYSIEEILSEESETQGTETSSSLTKSLTQLVENHRKDKESHSAHRDLDSASTSESSATSETVESLRAKLKELRGLTARQLVTRHDFEKILVMAASFEELSSAPISYISRLAKYRNVIKDGLEASERVHIAKARAKMHKETAKEKQAFVDANFAEAKKLAERGDALYVRIFAIKKLLRKLEAERETVDVKFKEVAKGLSHLLADASEAYEEYHGAVRTAKDEEAAEEFAREATESAEIIWVKVCVLVISGERSWEIERKTHNSIGESILRFCIRFLTDLGDAVVFFVADDEIIKLEIMEEVRLSPLRQTSYKSSLSGRSTPRGSPRVHSGRTPRRGSGGGGGGGAVQWFRSSRLVYWLLLITLWTYLGFYVQSRWAHDNENKVEFLRFGGKLRKDVLHVENNNNRFGSVVNETSSDALLSFTGKEDDAGGGNKRTDVSLSKKDDGASRRSLSSRQKTKKAGRASSRSKIRGKQKVSKEVKAEAKVLDDEQDPQLPMTNATYGKLLGPFGSLEDRVLEWSPHRRSGTCDRKSDFKRLVWSRRFVLLFHELSMTGAPISMMELASELLSCGATVSAVVLSRRGGLMQELARRKIKVVEDKGELSFKTAMKADLVIAGSAVCTSWIDQYMNHHPAGGSQIAWWIMENRREYFDRAKPVLDRVKMLVFLSESQSKQWLTWCEEEHIKLRSQPVTVPLSVNDELAFVAGIPSSLNTPTLSPEKMREKRQILRESVRKELGLTDEDMLVMSLSSINPGKGQLLLLESVALALAAREAEAQRNLKGIIIKKEKVSLSRKHRLRGSSREMKSVSLPLDNAVTRQRQELKVLLGSVGSKSNKVGYVQEMLSFLSNNGNLSKSVIWTPATTRVASLYSAADVYVTNSQGVGETFGRVTIEAMAYGLAVVGTDAGGTKEMVEHNVTGLLHSMGRSGNKELAQNLLFLLRNPETRLQFGIQGRKKVEKMYMKQHMYKRFVDVLVKCMRP
ncbi:unnamed protein product [Thlaspi arvense]|uniref:Glycosyl transferase family 1 domain-containing protein n=1 Tax=Thlaspi arvense TaxID=13288 RepID=A0AAU9R959_THLAR|nr:unnamed protein product [Thlaspi arvense]